MFTVDIPGHGKLEIRYLVSDYNGTLACDGTLLPGLDVIIPKVAELVDIHVVTADTFGVAAVNLAKLPVTLRVLPAANQDFAKAAYVRELGAGEVVAMGNGRNDMLMLKEAALGICLINQEGACTRTLGSAEIVCSSAATALGLFLNPKRLIATLRR